MRTNTKIVKEATETSKQDYSYYSRVLQKPFDSLAELSAAEGAYYAEKKAKEDKAAQKKNDAQIVEGAFKALNAARKEYKEKLSQLTTEYSEELSNIKKAYELGKSDLHTQLATAEQNWKDAIKNFSAKYPEGYHMTLKDGDFETTISSNSTKAQSINSDSEFKKWVDIFNSIFTF